MSMCMGVYVDVHVCIYNIFLTISNSCKTLGCMRCMVDTPQLSIVTILLAHDASHHRPTL